MTTISQSNAYGFRDVWGKCNRSFRQKGNYYVIFLFKNKITRIQLMCKLFYSTHIQKHKIMVCHAKTPLLDEWYTLKTGQNHQ